MRHLKDFGFGKKQAMQGFVNEEMDAIIRQLDDSIEERGGVLSPNALFQLPSFNLAWASAAGFRFDHNDAKIKELLRLNSELIKAVRVNNPGEAFPILKKIFPSAFGYKELFRVNRTIQEFIRVKHNF